MEYVPWIVASVAVAGFIINTVLQIRGGAWSAARDREGLKSEVLDKLDKLRSETTHSLVDIQRELGEGIEKARTEARTAQDTSMKAFGETIHALKEKIHSDALAAEKTFLRREDFFEMSRSKDSQLAAMDKKIEERFGRIEAKLDQMLVKHRV